MPSDTICLLCGKQKTLCKSHIIPKFVFRWIKKTSTTGYFRKSENLNIRFQDGEKRPLLCSDCEELFSRYESEFAKNIFYPYVQTEMDSWGCQTGKIKSFKYDDWLLKFIISAQFRFCSQECDNADKVFGEKRTKILKEQVRIWRDYLLEKRSDTGENRSYIIFLQNLVFGHGYLPEQLSDRVNFYLLRSVDSTLFYDNANLGSYLKLGPMLILTSLIPSTLSKMNSVMIKKNGELDTVQNLRNPRINHYIFVDRPREAMQRMIIPEKQRMQISKYVEMNSQKTPESIAVRAAFSDKVLKLMRAKRKE